MPAKQMPAKQVETENPETRHKLKKSRGLVNFVTRLVHQNDCGIGHVAAKTLHNLSRQLIFDIARVSNELMNGGKTKTVTIKCISFACHILFGNGDLYEQSTKYASDAVDAFLASKEKKAQSKGQPKAQSKSKSAGLTFPVTLIQRMFMEQCAFKRKAKNFAVYLAAIVESVIHTVIVSANEFCSEENLARIKGKHIKFAVEGNPELAAVFRSSVIGVGVHSTVVKREKKAKSEKGTKSKGNSKKSTSSKNSKTPKAKKGSEEKSKAKPAAKKVAKNSKSSKSSKAAPKKVKKN